MSSVLSFVWVLIIASARSKQAMCGKMLLNGSVLGSMRKPCRRCGTSGSVEIPVDLAPERFVCVTSPADMALELLQQRLPTRQTDGSYQISPDQYHACVLAMAPLQRLWIKAGEHNLQHCFGDRARIHDLLKLVTPETWRIYSASQMKLFVFFVRPARS